MTPARLARITNVLNKRQPDLTVVTDEVHKPRNLAAIVRNCDAVGVDTVHCVMPEQGYQIYSGTAASAEKWIELAHYSRIEEPLVILKEKGLQLLSANLSEKAVDYRDVDYTVPTAIIMGAEVKGVSSKAVSLCDREICLPMLGMVESYNVSVANALILAQAQDQRQRAGLYKKRRMSDELFKKRFFDWAHPVIAEFCTREGIPYPEIRSDGEILQLSQWYKSVNYRI